MNYFGMPLGMWLLFKGSFQKNMTAVLGLDQRTAAEVTARAKPRYKEIIARLPEFEKGDRFKMNLVNCALLAALPAMCALDYAMSEAGGASDFVRQYTLASGGPYCDCGYHKLKISPERKPLLRERRRRGEAYDGK